MTINSLNSIEERHKHLSSAICVVGSGVAGILFARRIAQGGRNVIVVESGESVFDYETQRLNEIEDSAARYSRALTGRHRGLGGTSSRWGGRMIPISAHEAGARQYVSQPQWPLPIGELDSYQREIERLFGTGHDSYEDIAQDKADAGTLFPRVGTPLTPRWAKCPTFRRCNIATLLRDDLKNLKGMEIWVGATVCEFELDRQGGRLRAITARSLRGKELTVRADHFVIAAGTIETTRLLLLLDRASDQHAFRRCKVLGRYFQDHLKAEVATISRRNPVATNRLFGYQFVNSTRRDLHLELSKAAQREDAVASAFAYVSMDLAESPLGHVKRLAHGLQRREVHLGDLRRVSKNLGLLARTAYWRLVHNQLFIPASVDLRLLTCIEQLPHWNNWIRLGETQDRFGLPKALFEWSPTEADERTFRSAISHVAAYWSHAGFDRLCPLIWTKAAGQGAAPIIDEAEACAHPSGSTRMGTDPEGSVVGPDLFCHDVPNVAALSASVFPTAGSANPTLTIMKLALWLADSYLRNTQAEGRITLASGPDANLARLAEA